MVKEQRAKAAKGGKKADMRGGYTTNTSFKSLVKFINEVMKKFDEAREAVKAHEKMDRDDPRTKETAARRKETVKAAQALAKKVDAYVAVAEE